MTNKNCHTSTYQSFKIKDLFHRRRLNRLKKLAIAKFKTGGTYGDFGCSEGFVTNELALAFKPSKVFGFDHHQAHLQSGRAKYDFDFAQIDLNVASDNGPFDAVTCLETLEHVGNLEQGLECILRATGEGGTCIISVPVEIGWIGLIKGIAKIYLFGYSLSELSADLKPIEYLSAVAKNQGRISCFRNKKGAKGYGTHFGFDYRDIGDILTQKDVKFDLEVSGTTAFFIVEK